MAQFDRFRLFLTLTSAALVVLLSQNCSDVGFSDRSSAGGSLGECLEAEDASCGEETTNTLKSIQPAVAVRGMSCLMCHAEIRANIITDFGKGTPWYWGGSSAPGINDKSWYNNYVNTWQSARTVVGTLFVPDDFVPRSVQDSMGSIFRSAPNMKIVDVLFANYQAPVPWEELVGNEARIPMTAKIAEANGAAKVVAKSEILIRAPTENEIEKLAPELFASAEVSGAVYMPSGLPVNGLVHIGEGTSSYIKNDSQEQISCANSDIVVKGTLYLKSFSLNAAGGCRIYVSGSVFIEDEITYGAAPLQNLQITSANGIFMGIDEANLIKRLIDDSRGLQISGPRTYSERANQALAEARRIGSLRDAKSYAEGRKSIDFTGLLLNAPIIQSRYLGHVKGTIVAEAALFSLGEFHFDFDPVFTQVYAFPLLKKPILGVR